MGIAEAPRFTAERTGTPETIRDFSVAQITPGQGSQSVGMGADLARVSLAAARIWKMAEGILGSGFIRVCREGPEEELMRTENTQPAVVIDSLARRAALDEMNLYTDIGVHTGNSLGWYAAAINVGSLSHEDGAKLVRDRGDLIRAAGDIDSSLMAVVDGSDETYEALRKRGLYLCLDNAPNQKVFGGRKNDLQKAAEWMEGRSETGKSIFLPVDGAFHSPLVESVVEPMRRKLEQVAILPPKNGILIGICNVRSLTTPSEIIKEMLDQFTNTVQWRKVMEYLRKLGVVTLLELGNTARLTNMNTDLFDGSRERIASPRNEGGPRPPTIAYIKRVMQNAA